MTEQVDIRPRLDEIKALADEFRPTMDRDVLFDWAEEAAANLPAMAAALTAVLKVLDAEMSQAEQHLSISRTNHSLGERMLGQHTGASRVIGSVRTAITDSLGGDRG